MARFVSDDLIMRKTIGLSTAVLALAAVVYAADSPLAVRHLVTGPASHVELMNTGGQPITAWSLAISVPLGDGRTRRFVQTVDAYLSEVTQGLPGSSDKLDRLRPGQSRQIALNPLPDGATVEVLAVVLDDGTAVGDLQTINAVLERRAAERDELHRVVDIFADVLRDKRGKAALEDLRNRFSTPPPEEESTPHRAAREAVESYLKRTTAENENAIDQLLRNYVALVQRQYDLAVRHSRGKTP